jgi:hypothetical protein
VRQPVSWIKGTGGGLCVLCVLYSALLPLFCLFWTSVLVWRLSGYFLSTSADNLKLKSALFLQKSGKKTHGIVLFLFNVIIGPK